jgi:hypothetical protein
MNLDLVACRDDNDERGQDAKNGNERDLWRPLQDLEEPRHLRAPADEEGIEDAVLPSFP